MPFGISGAPLGFQRLIYSVLAGLLGDSVFAFLDIIIVSKDISSYLNILHEVFSRLQSVGLTLKLSKCKFIKTENDVLKLRTRR